MFAAITLPLAVGSAVAPVAAIVPGPIIAFGYAWLAPFAWGTAALAVVLVLRRRRDSRSPSERSGAANDYREAA